MSDVFSEEPRDLAARLATLAGVDADEVEPGGTTALEGLRLNAAFVRITSASVREYLVSLAEALASADTSH